MNQIGDYLRKVTLIHTLAREVAMMWRRWRHGLRFVHRTFYMAAGARVARDCRAGEYSFVGAECIVCPNVTIGRYTMIASRVSIVGGDHKFRTAGTPIIFAGRPDMPSTVIEDDVWVGHGAIILAGVRIGRAAIVGAGSVVTKDVQPYTIVAGNPAKRIGVRFEDNERAWHDQMLNGSCVRGQFCGPR